tara:strand:- start:1016 stop:1792 length:777 start_codon:yes stop_codon:yes gene_type:complete
MARLGMMFDLKRCIGCNAYVIACKMENMLPESVFFTRVFVEEVGSFPDVRRVYIPTLCNHCEDAPFEKACPSGVTHTRDDGVLMVDQEKCIGCSACAVACPYDNRTQFTKEDLHSSYFGQGEQAAFEKSRYERWLQGNDVAMNAWADAQSIMWALLGTVLVMLLGLLHAAYHGSPGGKVSAQLLLHTLYAKWFYGVVFGTGVGLPLLTMWLGDRGLTVRLIVAIGTLTGFYAFRVLVFKAGVYEPVMQFGSLFGTDKD